MRAREGGWVGMIVVLVALVIVAFLAKEALKQYGLAPPKAATNAGTPGERVRAVGAVDGEALQTDTAPQAPASALERARGIEDMVKREAEERASRMDGLK